MANRIQTRRDTAANWTSVNPILAQGEQGWETDTGNLKIGDGSTAWTSLGYAFDSRFSYRGLTLLSRLAPANSQMVGDLTPAVDTPTVTSGSSQTITAKAWAPWGGNTITEVGSRGTFDTSQLRLPVSGKAGLDFFLEGTAVEFNIFPNYTGTSNYWVFVNGRPVTATSQTIVTTASTNVYVKLTFPSAAKRRIEFFMGGLGSWYGATTSLSDSVFPAPRKPVVAFVGDSFYAGNGGSDLLSCADFLISRQLGVECYSVSFGGTGYVNAGTSSVFGSSTRLASIVAGNPELIVIQGSVNDDGQSGIQAAASAMYSSLATQLPKAKLIVLGPQPSNSVDTVSANRSANIAAVKAAAIAAPNVIAFYDMVGSAAGVPADVATYQAYPDGTLVKQNGSVYKVNCPGGTYSNGPYLPPSIALFDLATAGYSGTGKSGTNRSVTDGVTTNASTTITSATAAFTSADVGLIITGAGIPSGTTIASVTNGTTAVLSVAATATASGVALTITNQTGNGTRDTYLYSDGIHPTPDGSQALAMWSIRRIREALKTNSV